MNRRRGIHRFPIPLHRFFGEDECSVESWQEVERSILAVGPAEIREQASMPVSPTGLEACVPPRKRVRRANRTVPLRNGSRKLRFWKENPERL